MSKVINEDVSTAIRNRVQPDPDYDAMAERLDEIGLSVTRHSRRCSPSIKAIPTS